MKVKIITTTGLSNSDPSLVASKHEGKVNEFLETVNSNACVINAPSTVCIGPNQFVITSQIIYPA